jgi:murein DD-endopeptidase MepM/ murein hydrolase activator NlpD
MNPKIRWPLQSNIIRNNVVSNTFGMVRKKVDGSKKPHQGWDFFAPIGTQCFAIADGKIAHIGTAGDYGKVVVQSFVFEGKTLYAAFAHLSMIGVTLGQQVKRGDKIALTGDTGNAKGMKGSDLHLHFEIRSVVTPGLGLAGRVSPLEVFRQVPLDKAVIENS